MKWKMHRTKMEKPFYRFSFFFIIFTLNFLESKSIITESPNEECETIPLSSRAVSYYSGGHSNLPTQMCWTRRKLEGSMVLLKIESLFAGESYHSDSDCSRNFIEVSEWDQDKLANKTIICASHWKEPVYTFQDIMIRVQVTTMSLRFTFSIISDSPICHTRKAFRCRDICIPRNKVCDGFIDCENGLDEAYCDNRILSVEGIEESRSIASNWLEKNSNSSSWRNNLHRTIVALHLSGKVNFSNRDYVSKNNLLAKQLELDTTVAMLRNSTNPVSSYELSMIINALLVTCQNPRQFYGYNLVQILKEQIMYSDASIQPAAFLALCNAHELLPKSSIDQLLQVLTKDSGYHFIPEFQAIAVMAVSCLLKNGREAFSNDTLEIYNASVKKLKLLQNEDGSFGNVYTTALITQALISRGERVSEDYDLYEVRNEEDSKDWDMKASIQYLINQMSSTLDYLSVYYILPILNLKSLADIAGIDCAESSQNADENSVTSVAYYRGPKIQIKYSLYLGTDKDVINTVNLSVPEKKSAFEIMELAAMQDPKYKFRSKSISGKIYVFEIYGFINDPEAGLFWHNYLESERFNNTLVQCEKSLDEIELQENDHLIMWYKRAHI